MILSDSRILEEIDKGTIKIVPYDGSWLVSISYDINLGKWVVNYSDEVLDAKNHFRVAYFVIPDEGFILPSHVFYLGVTEEYTELNAYFAFLEGKSSTGLLGLD